MATVVAWHSTASRLRANTPQTGESDRELLSEDVKLPDNINYTSTKTFISTAAATKAANDYVKEIISDSDETRNQQYGSTEGLSEQSPPSILNVVVDIETPHEVTESGISYKFKVVISDGGWRNISYWK